MDTPLEDQNIGNLKSIGIISLDDLLSIPPVSGGEISYTDLTFKTGTAFQDIYFTPETGSFTDQSEYTSAYEVWNKEINFEIPKIRSEIIKGLKNYENRKLASLIIDGNNTAFLVFPVRLSRKKQIPGQIPSKNSILVNLNGQSEDESPVITNLP